MRRLHLVLTMSLVSGCAAAPAQRSATPSSLPAADQPHKDGTGGSATFPSGAVPSAPTSGTSSFKPGDEDKAPATLADAQKEFELRAQAFQAAGSDCVTMCKALASMRRAAEHICSLAEGGADADKKRCSDAKEKVAGAATKVKESCGGC